MSEYLSREEVKGLGLQSVGEDVQIDRSVRFYGRKQISIGSNVRIDAFTIIATADNPIKIGSYIHIASNVYIGGRGGASIGDFVNLSKGVSIFTSSDDYTSSKLCGPMVPRELTGIESAYVRIEDHCIIGCNSVVLPGAWLKKGVAVGALSLVSRKTFEEGSILVGTPVKVLHNKGRNVEILEDLAETVKGE